MNESEIVSHSVMSNSLQLHGLYLAHQGLLSEEFSRQEYWSGLPFPSPGDLPSPGIFPVQGSDPGLLHCRQILYLLSHQGSLTLWIDKHKIICVLFLGLFGEESKASWEKTKKEWNMPMVNAIVEF